MSAERARAEWSAWTWTPEEVAKRKAMLADPACLLDAKEMVLSLLDEIERLHARIAELDVPRCACQWSGSFEAEEPDNLCSFHGEMHASDKRREQLLREALSRSHPHGDFADRIRAELGEKP